uniref:Uncharacterized protein n=1 Tax=viral metagenome TaxID=1070528 RepID=A0A6C0CA57_9ZZZZ
MDQHLRAQSLVNANLHISIDITLNRPILDVQSLVNANFNKSLDITLNRPILVRSKSCK